MVRSVLITGATGYIGSKLVQSLLEQGDDVHIVVRKGSSRTRLESLLDKIAVHHYSGKYEELDQIFVGNKIDTVFHLATWFNSSHKPENIPDIINSNILFGNHLLEAMAQRGCSKMVNTGTYWQQGETGEYHPNTLYAASKQAFSDILDYYVFARSISAITIKLYDVYGRGDTRGKIFNVLDNAYKDSKLLEMTSGEQQLCLTHIDDVVAAFMAADSLLDKPQYNGKHSVFFAGADALSLKEVVKTYIAVTGKKIEIKWGALSYRPGQIMKPYEGEKLPGWKAKVNLEQGIRESFL